MVGPDTVVRTKPIHAPAERQRHGRELLHWTLALVGFLLVVLSSGSVRHWAAESAATICVVGGFIAAPILTITAWIGMMAPHVQWLHRISTILFLVAVIWLALAFISAHLHYSRQRLDQNAG